MSMITGVSTPRWRSSRSTSNPLSRGSITSSSTQIERFAGRALEPALAVGARSRRHSPRASADRSSVSTRPGSSSMRSSRFTRRMPWPGASRQRRARPSGSSLAAGRTTVNALPAPGALRTVMRPAMRLDDALDEAQAEPGALNLRRDDVGRAIERLEDARLIG